MVSGVGGVLVVVFVFVRVSVFSFCWLLFGSFSLFFFFLSCLKRKGFRVESDGGREREREGREKSLGAVESLPYKGRRRREVH